MTVLPRDRLANAELGVEQLNVYRCSAECVRERSGHAAEPRVRGVGSESLVVEDEAGAKVISVALQDDIAGVVADKVALALQRTQHRDGLPLLDGWVVVQAVIA